MFNHFEWQRDAEEFQILASVSPATFKICLIVFKALRFGQPKYISDMLSPPVTISHLTLHSDDDPYRLHEPRAVDEQAFAERSFVYTAPRLYNGLPATVKQQASVQSFKIHLKTFLFSRAYNSDTNTINEVYKLQYCVI